ncbi:hypothetical protein GCM10022405_02640 [Gibbsiella dentisursi]|uniref:Uncharacterized protein n=1 Tax=Gibbsiella dentisursi TaxID=796890 RepID=A0ABP7KL35_9GAMM
MKQLLYQIAHSAGLTEPTLRATGKLRRAGHFKARQCTPNIGRCRLTFHHRDTSPPSGRPVLVRLGGAYRQQIGFQIAAAQTHAFRRPTIAKAKRHFRFGM